MITENVYTSVPVSGCSKSEMAQAYFPNTANPDTARRNLSRWIKMNPKLCAELKENGYRERQKLLTPKQVAIIYFYLGEP